jgi:hypothetical protein
MDDLDYSWVRRTRGLSQSGVRSSSGREQFGAFFDHFSRRQNGFDLDWKIRRPKNPQPITKSAVVSSSGVPPIPRAKSAVRQSERKLKHSSSDSQLNQEKRTGGRSRQEASAGQDRKGNDLSLDIPQRHVVQPPTDESPDTMEFSFHSKEQSLHLQRVCSSPAPLYSQGTVSLSPVDDPRVRSTSFRTMAKLSKLKPKQKQRAKSPIPTRVISDVFKEAKAATKRFSSPQKQRKSSSPRSPDDSPPFGFALLRTPSKLKITGRPTSWPVRKSDNGDAKVAASEILERWTVDRSQLLIGHRFASGAYSRLFHGIYKEQPVAVKFIRQPDDGEDDELSARLEKQFTSEVTILAKLQHRNVIKVTTIYMIFFSDAYPQH